MKLVIFGLTISSSWGNGHATLWRGLLRELTARGHQVVFFEKDVAYYAEHRDLVTIDGGELVFYGDFAGARAAARLHLHDADVAVITSYCPDAIAATDLVLDSDTPARVFYDMDTPVTLEQLQAGRNVAYLPTEGLGDFDLVLSFTGGEALAELKTRLNARHVAPLYGCVDPEIHCPAPARSSFRSDLSYLGTYSADRQDSVDSLFLEPARRLPDKKFLIGGSLYPWDFPWLENTFYVRHVSPGDHPAFYCSSRLTLNVTRRPMAQMGYCPSGRLFEAAACGTPIATDQWEGLEQFFTPGREILTVHTAQDVVEAMTLSDAELSQIASAARDRVLSSHTAKQRALELEQLLCSGVQTRTEA